VFPGVKICRAEYSGGRCRRKANEEVLVVKAAMLWTGSAVDRKQPLAGMTDLSELRRPRSGVQGAGESPRRVQSARESKRDIDARRCARQAGGICTRM
jgi:hypothetical protein